MIDDDLAFIGRDKCAVAGIGQTEFSRNSGRSVLSLATEAALKAIADAGLSVEDIDGIVRCGDDVVTPYTLAASLGARNLAYWADTGPGGVAPCMMMGLAMGAVLSGQAKAVLCFRSLNGRSETRLGSGGQRSSGGEVVGGFSTYDEFYLPYGLMTAGQTFALMTRRHMLDFGTTEEQLGAVAMACRENAQATPHAVMHGKPMSLDDYLASRMISTPLRLFDFCLETDGACAVIVTSTERARDLPKPPVLIRAVAGGAPRDHRGGMMFPVVTREMTELGGRQAGAELWRRAGVGPHEMDIAQIYDCFTISVILQLEAYGFCGKGEGGPFAASGAIRKGGSLPINNGGGHMSEGYVHGMNHIVQAVRQLRGEADNQIAGAELSLCTGGPLPVGSSVVFRKAA